jgi:4-hydroxysphinganine ceramide fatty acyl 2-hydroxylase
MKKNPVPLPARIVRTNIILTGVIPLLIPWFAIFFHNMLPDPITRLIIFTKGWLAWTLFEYCLHRWAFHGPRKRGEKHSDPFNHHNHHVHPDNIILNFSHRVVAISIIPISFTTFFIGHALISYVGGILLGASSYILLHRMLHYRRFALFFPHLLKHHIWHHCKFPNKCFGITSTIWDRMFQTIPVECKVLPDSILEFYFRHEGLDNLELARIARIINGREFQQHSGTE